MAHRWGVVGFVGGVCCVSVLVARFFGRSTVLTKIQYFFLRKPFKYPAILCIPFKYPATQFQHNTTQPQATEKEKVSAPGADV